MSAIHSGLYYSDCRLILIKIAFYGLTLLSTTSSIIRRNKNCFERKLLKAMITGKSEGGFGHGDSKPESSGSCFKDQIKGCLCSPTEL